MKHVRVDEIIVQDIRVNVIVVQEIGNNVFEIFPTHYGRCNIPWSFRKSETIFFNAPNTLRSAQYTMVFQEIGNFLKCSLLIRVDAIYQGHSGNPKFCV